MTVGIRPFVPSDGDALAEIFFASVRGGGLRDYTPEQVRVWAPARPDPAWFRERAGDGRTVLVAVDGDDRVLAYGDLEQDGHLDHLYCHPDHIGRGVAAALYDGLEVAARTMGVDRIFVEASEAARRLFERKGFVVVRRRDLDLDGVAIHNYAMEKLLGPTPAS